MTERIKWYFKQLLPLRYETTYRENGVPFLVIWRMWMGRCFACRYFPLVTDCGLAGLPSSEVLP
jgi:hypothetical protein